MKSEDWLMLMFLTFIGAGVCAVGFAFAYKLVVEAGI